VLHSEPVAPRLFESERAGDLETLCLKCLEKEPYGGIHGAGLATNSRALKRANRPGAPARALAKPGAGGRGILHWPPPALWRRSQCVLGFAGVLLALQLKESQRPTRRAGEYVWP